MPRADFEVVLAEINYIRESLGAEVAKLRAELEWWRKPYPDTREYP
jgi:hypothetical protein